MKKNLITVLKKLLKAFGGDSEQVKNNAVDIIDKIADNASSGGSSGLSFLTLYLGPMVQGVEPLLYKNIECTEGYSSIEEANEALLAATSIRVVAIDEQDNIGHIYFPDEVILANAAGDVAIPTIDLYGEGGFSLYIDNPKGNPGSWPK